MPAEVDAARFGASYAVSGDVMTTMYVIVLYLMLAAQEFLGHLLPDDAQRDLYCELAASTAGYAFGVQDQAPATISGLRQAWQAIIAGRLQVTDLGRQTREAMLARPIGGIPGRELAACAALLLPRTVAGWLGPLPGPPGPAAVSRHAGSRPDHHRPGAAVGHRRARRGVRTPARR